MAMTGLVLAIRAGVRGGDGLSLGGRIALIEINGLIGDDANTIQQIREFRGDGSVKGYVVAINSPGGVVGPAQSIYEELRRLRDEDHRPVVASIGAVGASGGYYVALAADSIFALPGSITGSIGVIMEFPDASRLMDRVGVQWEVVKSGAHKDMGSPFRPVTPGDRAVLGALVDDVFNQFTEAVIRERQLPPDTVQRLADGRVLSGRQALHEGLVDRLGNLYDAESAAGRMAGLGARPRIVQARRRRSTLLDLVLGGKAAGLVDRLLAPAEVTGVPHLKFVVPW